jgi:predicted  nucleic acid-binding Zn-ribbon protein
VNVKEQLLHLLRIQELVLEGQGARSLVDGAPARIEEIEARFRERNAEYVSLKDRHDTAETDRKTRSIEVKDLEETRKKFIDSLMQVKNQREYAAVLKEIDAVKARLAEHEDAILKDMVEIETLSTDLEGRAAHIEVERAQVEVERAQVDAEVEAARAVLDRCDADRKRIEAELPAALVATIRRIEGGRRGVFLVKVERELCQSCHVRVRPQVYQEIKQAAKIHTCSNCRRVLYFEPALRPKQSEPTAPDSPSEVAVNDGAV